MSDIYKIANYILAVPDLHKGYLMKNTANHDIFELIKKYSSTIYDDIHHINNTKKSSSNVVSKLKNKLKENNNDNNNNEEIKKVNRFLAFLIDDWSSRAWVISEYLIAKEKQQTISTPIKYMFISLLCLDTFFKDFTFFSYSIDDHCINDKEEAEKDKANNILKTNYDNVDNSQKLIKYFKTRFTQRNHLNMILNSNTTRNEDRFNVILPTWTKYQHLIKDKNIISEWEITNMISVSLKIYQLMT